MSTSSVVTAGVKVSPWRVPGRIAYVVSYAYPYANHGYAVRTHGVATALQQHGHSVIVISRPGRPWDLAGFDDTAFPLHHEIDGVRYLTLREPSARALTSEAWQEEAAGALEATLRVFKPSAVMAASNWENALPALKAAQALGVPFFYEIRGFWEVTRASREPEWAQSPEYRQAVERKTWIARQAERVFTLNGLMRDELVRRGVSAERIELVPNGVGEWPEVGELAVEREALGIKSRYVVGYVGSFNPYEGLGDLIRAGAQLVASGVDLSLVLVGSSRPVSVNGDCPEALAYRRLAAELGMAERLILPGRVASERLGRFYGAMDLVVIPRQPLPVAELVSPIKPLEAAAHGKALLVSDVAPLAEFAQGAGAAVFRKGDVAHLIEQMRGLLTDDEARRQAMGEQARVWVKEQRQFHATVEPITRDFRRLALFDSSRFGRHGQAASVQASPNQAKLLDIGQVDYATAIQWFSRQGHLSDTRRALESLQRRGENFDKPQLEFQMKVEGLLRLRGGLQLPQRGSSPLLATRSQHVLYCLHQSVPHTTNGYSTRSHGVAVGLQQAGWKVRATTRPGFPWDAGIVELNSDYHEAEVEGITYAAVDGSKLLKTPLDHYLAEAADHFVREAQYCGAEIIVAASNHITALPALMAARRLCVPFVYEVRGLWEVTKASTQPEWAGSEHYQLMRELEQQTAREADLVITLTDELTDELASWGIVREHIEVVPNAVNAERFQPMPLDASIATALKLKPGVPVIGYAGSAVAYEGLDLLMEALASLKQNGQAFAFVLVGDGEVFDTVKSKAKKLGIEEHCRFTGRVPFDQVPRYLSCMDIMPIPRLSSAVTEMVSALKPLEAMAMGKALVLSDVSPHITMAGKNGQRARLFKKDSADALSKALQALIDNPEERKRLGQAARAWIEHERTWNQVTRRYAAALQRVRSKSIETVTYEVGQENVKPLVGAESNQTSNLAKVVKSPSKKLPTKKQLNKKLIALSIVDEISEECWKYEFTSYLINRSNYVKQVDASIADFCFLESCWMGNRGTWQYAFTSPGLQHRNAKALLDLLPRVKNKMPLLFWNKEDPMHYDKYLPIAKFADVIFTTDSNKIPDYKRDVPNADVYAVPFAAQQKICNPSGRFLVTPESVCFAGSYYGVGHDERKRQMDALLPSIIDFKGAIYDRMSKIDSDRYKFPAQYTPFIRDAVPFTEVVKLYKRFKVFLNVNTIVDSPTMMSRRVYELLACGTPVVSTPSKAIEEQFSGIVHVANDAREANEIIEKLLSDDHYWEKTSHIGYREVMKNHTYAHRYQDIRKSLGYTDILNEPLVSIIICTRRPSMIDRIVENVTRQTHPNCELILVLQDFSPAQREKLLVRLKARKSNIKKIEAIVENNASITLGQRFNRAAEFAKGEYISKMDDDDFYFEHYISDMLIPFTFGDYGLVGKREIYFYLSGSNKLIKRFSGKKHCDSKFVAGATFVFKSEVFRKYQFKSLNRGEDSDLLERLHKDGIKIYAADPYNFIVWRGDVSNHTWDANDDYFLSGKETKIVCDGFIDHFVRF